MAQVSVSHAITIQKMLEDHNLAFPNAVRGMCESMQFQAGYESPYGIVLVTERAARVLSHQNGANLFPFSVLRFDFRLCNPTSLVDFHNG
jgi:hypothetical protein